MSNVEIEDHIEGDGSTDESDVEVDSFETGVQDMVGSLPTIGMVFDTVAEAKLFYNSYARSVGFSIRQLRSQLSRKDKSLVKRVYVCSKQGFRQRHSRLKSPLNPIPHIRTGCKSSFVVKVQVSGKFKVVEFVEEHNHDFARAREVHMLNSQRSINDTQATVISSMYNTGIGPKQIHKFLQNEAGGSQNISLTRKDCANFIQRGRSEYLKQGDAQIVLNYFSKLQMSQPDFFYMVQCDEYDRLASCFWCDGRSRKDYKIFNDVLCFDTTFKTNGYNLPYAPFVGVNHHGQSILFLCGLIFNSSTDSFVWLFRKFLTAMKEKHTKTIFIDQEQTIGSVIEIVFPGSHHRLCLWHIYKNAGKHLSHVFQKHVNFFNDFNNCVYRNKTEEEFEDCWKKLITTYGLETNDWITKLYGLRYKWALVFGRQHFCAGITTTQRSESINSYFKKYFKKSHLLYEFVQKYGEAVSDRREQEITEDHNSRKSIPIMRSRWFVESEASNFYPRKKFARFQAEVQNCTNLFSTWIGFEGGVSTYKVSGYNVNHYRTVLFNELDNTVICSCKGFEFTGILCSHSMKVLQERKVSTLNPCHCLTRWGKDATANHVGIDDAIHASSVSTLNFTERYSRLTHYALEFAMKGATTQDSSKVGLEELMKGMKKLDLCMEASVDCECTESSENANLGQSTSESVGPILVKDPARKKRVVQKGKNLGNTPRKNSNRGGMSNVAIGVSQSEPLSQRLDALPVNHGGIASAPSHSFSYQAPLQSGSIIGISHGCKHTFFLRNRECYKIVNQVVFLHGFPPLSYNGSISGVPFQPFSYHGNISTIPLQPVGYQGNVPTVPVHPLLGQRIAQEAASGAVLHDFSTPPRAYHGSIPTVPFYHLSPQTTTQKSGKSDISYDRRMASSSDSQNRIL